MNQAQINILDVSKVRGGLDLCSPLIFSHAHSMTLEMVMLVCP